MKKSTAILISLLAGVAIFLPLDYWTGWDRWFPFVHPFNLVLVATWSILLYLCLTRVLRTPGRCFLSAGVLLLLTLPQALFCVLVYSAWACVGISLTGIVLLTVRGVKLRGRGEKNL